MEHQQIGKSCVIKCYFFYDDETCLNWSYLSIESLDWCRICVQYNYYKLPFAKEKVLTNLLYFILYILFFLSHDSLMLPNRTFTYRLLIQWETNNQVNMSIWLSNHLPPLPYNGNKTYNFTKTSFKKNCLSSGLSISFTELFH